MNAVAIGDVLNRLTERDGRPRRSGDQWSARCPAHHDHNPSLSVAEGDSGKVLLTCHAGCDLDTILGHLGLTVADLAGSNGHGPEVARYEYVDEAGAELFTVHRADGKRFRQSRPDSTAKSGRRWKLDDTRRVLYRLPEVLAAVERGDPVYVVEGEKDVHAIERAGAVATCNPGGAGKWLHRHADPPYREALAGARVVVVADRDPAGADHARQVAADLADVCDVTVVQAAEGKDAADHLGSGHGLDDLVPADHGAEVTPDPFIDWAKFWKKDRREAEWLYEDVLAKGRGHALFAGHKDGKSLLMLWIAMQLVTSDGPVVVVYLDYEMGEDDLYERLEDMNYGPDTDMYRLRYWLLPTLPPLDSKAGADKLDGILDDVARVYPDHHVAVVIDTMGRAVDGAEDSADTFRAFYSHTGIRLKRRECTWARLDHAGKDKSKGQRGSSGKGDDVDVVWDLRATENGVELRRNAARMSWVPKRTTFAIREDPLRYLPVRADWPDGTQDVARVLDRLDVPVDASTRDAQRALRDANEGKQMTVIRAAVKWRRWQHEQGGTHPGTHLFAEGGTHPGTHSAETPQPSPGPTSGPTRTHPAAQSGPTGSPPRETQVSQGHPGPCICPCHRGAGGHDGEPCPGCEAE